MNALCFWCATTDSMFFKPLGWDSGVG